MEARYDGNVLSQLCSDGNTPVMSLSTAPPMVAALSEASGLINSAVTVAQNYTPAELAALTGDDMQMLVGLTCRLAIGRLLQRRPTSGYQKSFEENIKEANEFLDRLRKGERIFAVQANLESGIPEVCGPSAQTFRRLNMLADRCYNYYPRRNIPLGRG
jgi:hypothetical protein